MRNIKTPQSSDELKKAVVVASQSASTKKPVAYVLIDVAIAAVLVEPEDKIEVDWCCNQSLCNMLSSLLADQSVDFQFIFIAKKTEVKKEVVTHWDPDSKLQEAVCIPLSKIFTLFNAQFPKNHAAPNVLSFEANTQGVMQFSRDILSARFGAGVSPKQIMCFSSDEVFLKAVNSYGGVDVRMAKSGEIDEGAFAEVKTILSAPDSKKYVVKKVVCDIDQTALMRPFTLLQKKTAINPVLPVAELKQYQFEWEVLTARGYGDGDAKLVQAIEQFKKNNVIQTADLMGILNRIAALLLKVNGAVPMLMYAKEREKILAVYAEASQAQFVIDDYAPSAANHWSCNQIISFVQNYHATLKTLLELCGIFMAKIFDRPEFSQEQVLINADFIKISLAEKMQHLDMGMYHFNVSVSAVAQKFKDRWGCSLDIKQHSYTDFSQSQKRKFVVIKEIMLEELKKLATGGKGLAIFFDDNSGETAAAVSAKADLQKLGITLLVVAIYSMGELYGWPTALQQKTKIAGFIAGVKATHISCEENDETDEVNKENHYSQGNTALIFKQPAVLGKVPGKLQQAPAITDRKIDPGVVALI